MMRKSWNARWAETVVFGLVTICAGAAFGGGWFLAGCVLGILLGIAVSGLVAERALAELKETLEEGVASVREEIQWTPRTRNIS